jgi:hypothetical protein
MLAGRSSVGLWDNGMVTYWDNLATHRTPSSSVHGSQPQSQRREEGALGSVRELYDWSKRMIEQYALGASFAIKPMTYEDRKNIAIAFGPRVG